MNMIITTTFLRHDQKEALAKLRTDGDNFKQAEQIRQGVDMYIKRKREELSTEEGKQ